jgi:hypothetical protein
LSLPEALKRQPQTTVRTAEVVIQATGGQHEVYGWVQAYRLTAEPASRARQRCRQRHKKGTPSAESLFLAGRVLVLTTLAPAVLTAQAIMDLYRWRWQVGVSREGHMNPVGESPTEVRSLSLVAREAPWRAIKTVEPSDMMLLGSMHKTPGGNVQ